MYDIVRKNHKGNLIRQDVCEIPILQLLNFNITNIINDQLCATPSIGYI